MRLEKSKENFCAYSFVFFIAAILFSTCAAPKFKIDKTPLSQHFEINPVFKESHSGLLVFDVDENKVLFNYNSDKHFTPASNIKLITYFAALKMMGDSIPSLEYCMVNDTLFFTGTGDPTLLYANFEYGKTLHFLDAHEGQLSYVNKPIEDNRLGPGWSWDDYPYYYSAEKSSFPIYGNMAYFNKKLTDEYVKVVPDHFNNNLSVKQDLNEPEYSINRDEFKNNFELLFNGKPFEIEDEIPFIYSDELFIKLLSDTLSKSVLHQSTFPDCETKTLYAIPTDSVSKHILIESDNFLAEHMLLLLSNQLSDTLSSKKAIKAMVENHLTELSNEVYWVDGSGLSRYNQVTPNAMVSVLKELYKEVPKDKLYQMLPESGSSGTLQNSYPGTTGKIHAKTGSMSHVYNLSGYLETNSGKTLLFSFMNNNFNVSFSELKYEIEKVLASFINDN